MIYSDLETYLFFSLGLFQTTLESALFRINSEAVSLPSGNKRAEAVSKV